MVLPDSDIWNGCTRVHHARTDVRDDVGPGTVSGADAADGSHVRRNAMALNLSQKKEVVAQLAEVASSAHSLVAAEYAGITVGQLTDLRKKARQAGVFLKVAKNTLVERAVEGTEYGCVQGALTGPLLYAFSQEDPGAAGRLIKDFAKTNDKLKPRIVAIGGKVYPGTHVEVLANLPTREQALSLLLSVLVQPATMLVRVMAEPASQLARAINAVGEQKKAA